jgi:hypothetical protein
MDSALTDAALCSVSAQVASSLTARTGDSSAASAMSAANARIRYSATRHSARCFP